MKRAFFTEEQLNILYEATGRSVDREVLDAKAKELYPDIIDIDGRSPVFSRAGAGKAFLVNGIYVKGVHSLVSNYGYGIGILEDGAVDPY